MARLHPMLVHFPIALLLFGVLCDWLHARLSAHAAGGKPTGASSPQVYLGGVGLWATTAGTAMLLPAIATGLLAHTFQEAPGPQVQELINWHERLSYVYGFVFGGLVLWRWESHSDASRPLPLAYRALSGLAAVGMMVGSYLGGELVYRHRMGVDPLPTQEHSTEPRSQQE